MTCRPPPPAAARSQARRGPRLALSLALLAAASPLLAEAPDRAAVEAARERFAAGDHAGALPVLTAAAEAGDPVAQNLMGLALDNGLGLATDHAAALAWFEAAAAQGFDRAQFNLGLLLRDGRPGITPDPARARALFGAAARHGLPPARLALAALLAAAPADDGDLVAARALLAEAALAGDAGAAQALSRFLRDVPGHWQDPVAALAWCLYGNALAPPAAEDGAAADPCALMLEYSAPEEEAAARALAERLAALPPLP